jgi:hypothetical protein
MKRFCLVFKRLLLISVISGLITSNILTLLNNRVHEATFDILKTVLTSVVAKETLSHLLSNSPTQKYKVIEAEHVAFKQKRINTVKSVSRRIASRTEKRAIKSVSLFIPRVTPLIGAAITATLTVMEINDDCQTLKELNELNVDFEVEKVDETTVCGINLEIFNDYLSN